MSGRNEGNDDVVTSQSVSMTVNDLRTLMRESLDGLAGLIFADVHQFNFPPILQSFWWALIGTITKPEKKHPKIAIGIPRGHAKSTVIKLFIIWIILFTRKRFVLITCANATLANNILADVASMMDSDVIRQVFGDWNLTKTTDRAELKKFTFSGREIALGAIGAEGSTRGLNIGNARPDVMIYDDAQTKECSESEVAARKFIAWFQGTSMKAKAAAGTTYVYIGNMYKENVIETDEAGNPKIRGCHLHNLSLSEHWVSYIAGAIQADGTVLWPELHPYEDLLEELAGDIESGTEDEWFAEVQNDPTFKKNQTFRPELVEILDHHLEKDYGTAHSAYIVVDPSAGKKKSDDQAVGLFKVWDTLPVFTDLLILKEPQPIMVKKVIEFALTHQVQTIFIEDYGSQSSMTDWFDHWLQLLDVGGIAVIGVNRGKLSKTAAVLEYRKILMAKFQTLAKRVYVSVVKQAEDFDPAKTDNKDDILDVGYYGSMIYANPDFKQQVKLPINLEAYSSTHAKGGLVTPVGRYLR